MSRATRIYNMELHSAPVGGTQEQKRPNNTLSGTDRSRYKAELGAEDGRRVITPAVVVFTTNAY